MPGTNNITKQLYEAECDKIINQEFKKAWDDVLAEKMRKAVADKKDVLRRAFPEIAIMEKACKEAELKKIERIPAQPNQQPTIKTEKTPSPSQAYYSLFSIFGAILGKAAINGYVGVIGGALIGLFTGILTNTSYHHSQRKK